MNSKVIGVVISVVVIGVVAVVALYQPSSPVVKKNPGTTDAPALTITNTPATTTVTGGIPVDRNGYTLVQVATHNNASSCWTAINGNVYDVTSWISQHPGGAEAILSLCGKDGSNAFNGQHGGQTRPANELTGFKIGPLLP